MVFQYLQYCFYEYYYDKMMVKNEATKELFTQTIPAYAIIVLWIIFLSFSYFQQKNQIKPIIDKSIDENTWYTIWFWSWIIISWDEQISEIPSDERWYIEYLQNNWKAWIDYISVEPPRQPVIHWQKDENNQVKNSYFLKNRITFDIPKIDKTAYIMIVTKNEVANNRDFYLWLDWQSMWPIRKDKSLPVYDFNEYLYPLYWIVKAWFNWETFDVKSHIKNWKLDLNVFVWETWNYVERIIIFFK